MVYANVQSVISTSIEKVLDNGFIGPSLDLEALCGAFLGDGSVNPRHSDNCENELGAPIMILSGVLHPLLGMHGIEFSHGNGCGESPRLILEIVFNSTIT
jgi:hypothetical protein